MSVVNVKVMNIRPQYQNLKDWMKNPDHVYIGRAAVVFIDNKRYPPAASIWANPFKLNKHTSRKEILKKYKIYITQKINNDSTLKNQLLQLSTKKLGCWCAPQKCHGHVLLQLIAKYRHQQFYCDIKNSLTNDQKTLKNGAIKISKNNLLDLPNANKDDNEENYYKLMVLLFDYLTTLESGSEELQIFVTSLEEEGVRTSSTYSRLARVKKIGVLAKTQITGLILSVILYQIIDKEYYYLEQIATLEANGKSIAQFAELIQDIHSEVVINTVTPTNEITLWDLNQIKTKFLEHLFNLL